MNKINKLIFIGIVCFSVIIASFSYFLLQNEDISDSDSNSNNKNSELTEITNPSFVPKGIRLTFINSFNESVIISWFTQKNATNPNVIYSLEPDLSSSVEIKPNFTELSISTYFYSVELKNLAPNITYYYQVISDNINKREILNFTTMADFDTDHVRFLVYGDSRKNRNERSVLSKKIMEYFREDFDFTIHSGDIVEDGRLQDQWNNYFIDTETLNAFKQGIYVEGNHEGGDNTEMYNNIPMPNTAINRYYSFSYGDVGYVILNSNKDDNNYNDDQTDWLNQTLFQLSQKNTFNFAFLHHPLLDTRSYLYHREKWKPLFDKYNVSIIFCGHNHFYERSYPMTNSTTLEFDNSTLYNYENLNNSIYIISGGAGAPLYQVNDYDFIANTNKTYHFVLVDVKKDVEKTTLSLEAWGMPENLGNLYLFDNISITKWN
jgi:predicted phosphodiesterase